MPFGLTNVLSTFQQLMENSLGEINLQWCIIYLDDIIIFCKTPKDHIMQLRGVINKLVWAGLKLKPRKYELFITWIAYFGHIVSKDGVETDLKMVAAIANWPQPTTVTDVQSFLSFTNHYRRFIHKYVQIARPLNLITAGNNANKKKQTVQWNEDCKISFQKLKEMWSSTLILAYANYNKPFKLHTNAYGLGLGAVLDQLDDNSVDRVIAYTRKTLSKSERNYPAHKLEFLVLKSAITDRFHEYLYKGKFEVYTDNNPLIYVLLS